MESALGALPTNGATPSRYSVNYNGVCIATPDEASGPSNKPTYFLTSFKTLGVSQDRPALSHLLHTTKLTSLINLNYNRKVI